MAERTRFKLQRDLKITVGDHTISRDAFLLKKQKEDEFALNWKEFRDSVRYVLEQHYDEATAIRPRTDGGLLLVMLKSTRRAQDAELELLFRPDGLVSAILTAYNENILDWQKEEDIADSIVVASVVASKAKKHALIGTQAVVAPSARKEVLEDLQEQGWVIVNSNPTIS